MLKDQNNIMVSGKIFWSKLDERESYSTLRIGIEIGSGSYNRVFATISNPNEKAHAFVKSDNQVMLIGAWLDTWEKENGDKDLQIKAYDSNCQFYLPDATIPHLNEVLLYGKVISYNDEEALLDCIGGKNPKTGQYTHRHALLNINNDYGDLVDKKVMVRGTLGAESQNGKNKLIINIDYDNFNIIN